MFAQCFREPPPSHASLARTILSLALGTLCCLHTNDDVLERDSLKDRTIVTVFLLVTASLLGWALIKPFVVKGAVGDMVGRYTPVSVGGRNEELPGIGGTATQGLGGDAGSRRVGRGEVAGGRGSISRQGGLNS